MLIGNRSALFVLTLVATAAFAEGVSRRSKRPDTEARLYGVDTILRMPDGGEVAMGGSTLRRRAPGSTRFEIVHRLRGGSLYRVAGDKSGALLAAWEKEGVVHYFQGTRHRVLPTPKRPSEEIWESAFDVDHLAFGPNGEALIFMRGRRTPSGTEVYVAYRVPLEGGTPELLYRVDDGHRILSREELVVFRMPQRPTQRCEELTCYPLASVLAYQVTPGGVVRTELIKGDGELGNARMIWGNTDDRVVLELSLQKNQRAVLRWRPGTTPELKPLPRRASSEELFATNSGEILRLIPNDEAALAIETHAPDGGESVLRLPAPRTLLGATVHALGLRKDGRLWVHWGDSLLLFEKEPSRPPRAYDVGQLLTRRTSWGGHAVYDPETEALWLAIEVGGGRDFERVRFEEVERRAKPWAGLPAAANRERP